MNPTAMDGHGVIKGESIIVLILPFWDGCEKWCKLHVWMWDIQNTLCLLFHFSEKLETVYRIAIPGMELPRKLRK